MKIWISSIDARNEVRFFFFWSFERNEEVKQLTIQRHQTNEWLIIFCYNIVENCSWKTKAKNRQNNDWHKICPDFSAIITLVLFHYITTTAAILYCCRERGVKWKTKQYQTKPENVNPEETCRNNEIPSGSQWVSFFKKKGGLALFLH